MTKHTPEPWFVDDEIEPNTNSVFARVDPKGMNIPISAAAVMIDQYRANARRIVACVNACAEFEDPAEAVRLLGIEAAKAGAVDALRARVAELEAALKALESWRLYALRGTAGEGSARKAECLREFNSARTTLAGKGGA